jgi:hypothetical protein
LQSGKAGLRYEYFQSANDDGSIGFYRRLWRRWIASSAKLTGYRIALFKIKYLVEIESKFLPFVIDSSR